MASSSSSTTKTQTLDSTRLFLTALATFSHQPNPPQLSFPPIPSTFPHSKLIPKTRFSVDAFRHAGDHSVSYFLSHFHSDHYGGLSPNWAKGVVFCSQTTARLLNEVLKVSSLFVVALPLDEAVVIDGCEVVLIDANHCPGAVQFLFKVPGLNGKFERYVHTGDFRFSGSMKSDPFLCEFVGSDAIFLDTTYCNPKFVFPLQEESVNYIASLIETVGGEYKSSMKNVLFLVATYVIGKEKILLEIARRCNRKVHVDAQKMAVLRVLGYGESGVFTEDECESDVHVVGWNVLGETWPYFRPNFVKMKEIMVEKGYSKVVGFVPTGWTYEVKRNKFSVRSKDSFEIHLVPYSEHSNYDELREYVRFLKPKHVIPTVGLDVEKLDSKHANKMQKHFAGLVDEMANKKEFLRGFLLGSTEVGDNVENESNNGPIEGLDQEKEAMPSDKDTVHMELSSSLQEPDPQNPMVLNDEEVEKIIQELRDCLPTWVTQEQMLDLIGSSGGDIVESVSNFYERETEFHDQLISSTIAVSESQTSSLCDSGSLPKGGSVKSSPYGSTDVPSSQEYISLKPRNVIKSGISPGKRARNTNNKVNKRVKLNSKLDSRGPKQLAITKFFSKVLPDVQETLEIGSMDEQNLKDESLPHDDTKSYRDEIDQFLQIIDGTESLESYAATILRKTNGDINEALNIYYCNREVRSGKNEAGLVVDSGKMKPTADSSVEVSLQENVKTTVLSLPPEKYNPTEDACWSCGQRAPYLHLARTFDLLEDEKGKIKATSMLCNMFRSLLALSPEDVLPSVYLCTNKIAADHENVELNIGGSLVTSALEDACGTSRSKIREMYNELGDLGDVAQACRQTQKLLAPPSPLLIKDVFFALQKISVQTGSGSTGRKKSLIVNLMRSCREKEMKFLVRTLVRNLRIGAMMKTVLPALAQAVVMNSSHNFNHEGAVQSLKDRLQLHSAAVVEAYNVLPNLDLVVPSLMDKGIGFSSSTLSMVPGIPIKPMLAKITNGVQQALKLLGNKAFTCEYKYDGQRAQIHKLVDGSVHVFSRNGDESTSRFPDLIKIINESCKPDAVTFILDAEVVAIDRKNGLKLMSFQELSSRGRGSRDTSITLDSIKVDICVFVFDIMFVNGQHKKSERVQKVLSSAEALHKGRQITLMVEGSWEHLTPISTSLCSQLHEKNIVTYKLTLIHLYKSGLEGLERPLPAPRKRAMLDMPTAKNLKDMFYDEKLGYFEYAKEMTVEADDACLTSEATLTKINCFLENAFLSSCEGIMVKSLDVDAGYYPSKRTDTWLKVKRDYMEGSNDSLDLVPIGAWHGNGRKAGWHSPFLMACYNPDTEDFQSVCRVMSGFSDSFYTEMKSFFSGDKILSRKPPYYKTAEAPDMWFPPELVWEIRGADFTVSPVHQAAVGLVHPSRGISIRFPRYVRTVADRKPDECSTSEDIAAMFCSQTRKMDVAED